MLFCCSLNAKLKQRNKINDIVASLSGQLRNAQTCMSEYACVYGCVLTVYGLKKYLNHQISHKIHSADVFIKHYLLSCNVHSKNAQFLQVALC